MAIGTFGSFTQARLAIYASYKGLNVTGNNIANINTEGYTRQKLEQESFRTGGAARYHSAFEVRVGNGVLPTSVSQLRDPYLDIRYRSEMAGVGAMDTKLAGLEDIQAVLDEVGDGDEGFGILEAQLSQLYDALQQLSDQTGQDEYDIQVRSAADSLAKQFNSYAAKLEEVYENAITSYKQDVVSVNKILENIRDLNETIRKNEIHGDNALELRDERNLLIDQLSEYMKIDVEYTTEDIGAGQTVEKLIIKLGNANPDSNVPTDTTTLVDGLYARQLYYPKANPDAATNAGLPYLDADGNPTDDPAKAVQEFDSSFSLTLGELRDSQNRLMYAVEKMDEYVLTATSGPAYDAAVAGKALTTPQADGSVIITTFRAEVRSVLMENDGTLTNGDQLEDADNVPYKYLIEDTSTTPPTYTGTNDYKEASRQTVTTYYAQEYRRTPSTVVTLDDNDLYGALQSQRELLTESGEFSTAEALALDENASTKRGIPYYQKALDLLANKIATSFNEANQGYIRNEEGEYLGQDGNPLVSDGIPVNANGLTPGQEALITQQYGSLDNFLAANGQPLGEPLFSVRADTDNDTVTNADGTTTGITASNISISASWANGPQVVRSFILPTGMDEIPSTDSTNISHMINMFNQDMDYYPGTLENAASTEPMFTGSFQEMWVNIGTVLGNDMKVTSTRLDTFYASSVSLNTSRDSVSSVDLNDEAMNLMQYQHSYTAACRLMTTIDSVLDSLINGTGITR